MKVKSKFQNVCGALKHIYFKCLNVKIEKKIIRLLPYFTYLLLSFGVILRCLWALKHIYIMFMISVDQCILIWGDRGIHLRLRATEQSSFSQRRHYHANTQGVKTETLCYINGLDG